MLGSAQQALNSRKNKTILIGGNRESCSPLCSTPTPPQLVKPYKLPDVIRDGVMGFVGFPKNAGPSKVVAGVVETILLAQGYAQGRAQSGSTVVLYCPLVVECSMTTLRCGCPPMATLRTWFGLVCRVFRSSTVPQELDQSPPTRAHKHSADVASTRRKLSVTIQKRGWTHSLSRVQRIHSLIGGSKLHDGQYESQVDASRQLPGCARRMNHR